MKLLVVALIGCMALSAVPRPAAADLPGEINKVLQDKLFRRARVGIEIVRLGASPADAQSVYAKDAQTPLIPASNLKLLTSAAFLERMGPDFKFRTALLAGGGDVVLLGAGDPAFGDAEYLKKSKWGVTTTYETWATQLKRAGVTTVRDVIVDDSIFDEDFAHPNWPDDQIHKRYSAQVGGVNLNANCVDFLINHRGRGVRVDYAMDPATRYVSVRNTCVGGRNNVWLSRDGGGNQIILKGEAPSGTPSPLSVTIHDPPLFAGTVLAETLRGQGITVTGGIHRNRTIRNQVHKAGGGGGPWEVVAVHETPLAAVLARLNKD